jgi:prolyl 4-hydroxylase
MPSRAKNLKCSYLTNGNPFLLIGPIKQEEVFDKPQIWVYYDVITNKQIEIFKKLAFPKVRKIRFSFISFSN